MAEVLGMAAGYTPYRQNLEWEKTLAARDADKFIDIRRQVLINQFDSTVLSKDHKDRGPVLDAIRKFNSNLQPSERGKAITSDTLSKSAEAKSRIRTLQEQGLPARSGSVPIYRDVQSLYPESQRELRKVRPGMTP